MQYILHTSLYAEIYRNSEKPTVLNTVNPKYKVLIKVITEEIEQINKCIDIVYY